MKVRIWNDCKLIQQVDVPDNTDVDIDPWALLAFVHPDRTKPVTWLENEVDNG
jgi:hypothetical protein